MQPRHLVVFDLETGGLDPGHHEAVEVAAKAYDARTLDPFPPEEGGEFVSLMRPLYFDRLQEGALRVNKITREELEKAPDQATVWRQFVDWVCRWNSNGKASGLPVAGGKNIRDFDLKFVARLNELHLPKTKKKKKLFWDRTYADLQDAVWWWFDDDAEVADLRMDTLRPYFGLSSDSAHRALVDVRQTGTLVTKFLKLHRQLRKRRDKDGKPFIPFKGSCRGAA